MKGQKRDRNQKSIHVFVDGPNWLLFRELCRVELGMPANHVLDQMIKITVDQSQLRPVMEEMLNEAVQAKKLEATQEQVREALDKGIADARSIMKDL